MKLSTIRPAHWVFGWVLFTLIACVTVGMTLGLELALLCFAGTVGLSVVALFWLSLQNLSGETPLSLDEALTLGAPTAAEEQKRSVLRALKDLEFERSVGKISEPDYLEFSARYREEAKRLIAVVDQSLGPVQELAEKLVLSRLSQSGLGSFPKEQVFPDSEPEAKAEPPVGEKPPPESPEPQICAGCETTNDWDARFCKHCGAILAPEEPSGPGALEKEIP